MTNTPDALLPTAKELKGRIALAEAEEAEKQARARTEEEAEKKALIDQLRKPSGISGGGNAAGESDYRTRHEESKR